MKSITIPIYGTTLLFGSDINFSYMFNTKNYYFQWVRNDEIYLMEENFSSYKMKKESKDDPYYHFKISDFNQDSFIGNLNNLIEEVTHQQKK